jgi:16S rRNA (guanine527-N7)-methyltransferase
MNIISDQMITETLKPYGAAPTESQCQQIRSYISLLLRWNRSISLTTVTDEMEILQFHFGESIFGLRAVSGIEIGRLADVGAGAGFPGVPIRIFSPDLELLLIEANAKKCAFLSEVVRALNLENVRVVRGRFEEINASERDFDTIAARALGNYDDLLDWTASRLSSRGRIALWLGEGDAGRLSTVSGWKWRPAVPIPGSKQRVILSGTPEPSSLR